MKPAFPQFLSARFWRFAAPLLALAAIVGGGAFWLHQVRIAQVRAALPPAPTVVANPTLRDLVAKARADAGATGGMAAIAEFGRLLHANGFAAEAEACWRILINLQPEEPRWHYYLADLRRAAGDYVAAEEHLQLTVAADPAAASAWLQLAEMKFKSGRHDAAAADYRRRLALLPGDPYAGLGLARIALLQGRAGDALRQLGEIVQHHPQFSAAHNLYAELHAAAGDEELADHHRWLGREAGRFREADDPWMEEVNARCHDPKRLCHLGVVAYQTKQGDLGRSRFERAIALAPGDPLAYQLLGTLLLEIGSAGSARDVLARGVSKSEGATPGALHYLKLSEACRALNLPGPARQALTDGLRLHPDSPELLHAEGNALKADGQVAEAAAAYRRALELHPAFAESDFALAVLLLETDRREAAVAALRHALTMQPTFPKALLLLARLEIESGRIEEAGRHLLPLLKANPGAPEIRRITANWRLQAARAAEKSDPAEAERHYRAGLVLAPEHPELNAGLGVRLLISDRVPEALPLLETYHRLQPANAQASLFLGQAYARSGRLAEARRVLDAGLHQAEQAGQTTTAGHFREILSSLPR